MNNDITAIPEQNGKFAFIDIAKAIGILMVVFAHINVEGPIYKILYSFHIPLFFVIAGMTFKRNNNENFGQYLKKKAKRLLLPYLVYSIITFAWYALVEVKMPEFNHLKNQTILDSFFQIFLAQGSIDFMQHNPALWFIPCLFVTEILFYFVDKCRDWVKICVVIFAGVLGYVLCMESMPAILRTLPLQIGIAFAALPFMLFGNMICAKNGLAAFENHIFEKKWRSIIFIIIAMAAVIGLTYLNSWFLPEEAKGHISMGSKHLGNIGIFYTSAILGAMAIIYLSALLTKPLHGRIELHKSKLVWLGERSYAIMAIHFPVKRRIVVLVGQAINEWILNNECPSYTNYTSNNLFPSFIAFIFTMIFTVIIAVAAENYTASIKLPGKSKIQKPSV